MGFVTTGEGRIMLRSVDKSGRYPYDNIFDMLVSTGENQAGINAFISDVGNAVFLTFFLLIWRSGVSAPMWNEFWAFPWRPSQRAHHKSTPKPPSAAADKYISSEPGSYGLILMDVRMPVMNGHEAARSIRACGRSDAESISIVAMTANAFVDGVRDALEAGMDAHVSKPIVLDQRKETIREVLARKTVTV